MINCAVCWNIPYNMYYISLPFQGILLISFKQAL